MNQQDLVGFAFPVIRVRYAGPTDYRGSRYIASCRRGDETDRATVSYDYAAGGPATALEAARQCWAKRQQALTQTTGISDDSERVFVPGNLDDNSYAFTVVPAGFFA